MTIAWRASVRYNAALEYRINIVVDDRILLPINADGLFGAHEQARSDQCTPPAVPSVVKRQDPCRSCGRRRSACVRQLRRAGGAIEFTSQVSVQVSWLADRGILVSMPGPAHRVGHPGDLLFEFALGRGASGLGGGLCGIRDLGVLAVAPAAYVRWSHSRCFSAWSRGGSRYRPRMIATGGRRSR